MTKGKLIAAALAGLIVGYLAGREHARHQIAQVFASPAALAFAPTARSASVGKNAADYSSSLHIYDWEAGYRQSFTDGRVPGISFKLRNDGDRTVSEVEVTVYFQDEDGNTIAEETFFPVSDAVSFSGNGGPLRPGYVWQLEKGRFFAAKRVPSEWKEGAATVAITGVRFHQSP